MKKSDICRFVRTTVLMVVLFVLRYKFNAGFVECLLVSISSITWGLCEYIDTGIDNITEE